MRSHERAFGGMIVFLLASASTSSSCAESLCDGHGLSTKWEIRKGDDIQANVAARIVPNQAQPISHGQPLDMGYACPGRQLGFHVQATDPDKHICRTGDRDVTNYTEATSVAVNVFLRQGRRPIGEFTLDMLPPAEANAKRRFWDGFWIVPESATINGETINLVGQELLFEFSGAVDDIECTAANHIHSHDNAVDMGHYQTTITVLGIDTLTVSDVGKPSRRKSDSTDPDETPEDNTLLVVQNSEGQAQIRVQLTWLPPDASADDVGSRFLWELRAKEGGEATGWDVTGSDFSPDAGDLRKPTWTDPGGQANREFAVWAGCDRNGNGELDAAEHKRLLYVTVLKVALDETTFRGTGSHALKTDDGTYASDGTGDVRVPQIQVGATPRETQICYTWESSPEIAAKFSIVPNLATPVSAKIRIEGVQNGRAGILVYEKDVSLSGASITETFTTSAKLKKLVDNTTYDLTWKLSIDGGSTYCTIDTTANKLFAVAGSPGGGNTTLTRIGRVTDECKGLVNEPDIVQRLWKKVAGPASYVLGAPYPNPEWKILDGTPGECIAIANLFEKTIRMVGLAPGAGSVVYLYVDPAGRSHESPATDNFSTRDCRIGQNGHTATVGNTHHLQNNFEKLAFVDMQGGANNWEACYKYRHQAGDPWVWYAAGTGGASYNSVQDCMNAICDWTRWRYCNATWGSLGSCVTPGPHPERDW